MILLHESNGHSQPETVTWDRDKFKRFEKAYQKAVKLNAIMFVFDRHEFLTTYGKYLVEYLKGRFKDE
jgi:hypothetical protein